MKALRWTLLTDGSSDKTLINIIDWLLNDLYPDLTCEKQFADFRQLPKPPKTGDIVERVRYAKEIYPFDILFYHRDAESIDKKSVAKRKSEILKQIDSSVESVCIVPIVMMEAWLLIDEKAIKRAAGNRNYPKDIDLPKVDELESLKDPKTKLHELLKTTSGRKGRQLKSFNVFSGTHLVAEYITDFRPLRQLSAFKEFEKDLKIAINKFRKIDT